MKKLMNMDHITLLSNVWLVVLFTFLSWIPSTISDQPPVVCGLMNCGRGTCKASGASVLGFECECNPGWKNIQLGPIILPSCVLPNCTLNVNCGGTSLPPPPSPPPSLNLADPCGFIWCGDGKCVSNGTGFYSCQCSEDSANLMKSSVLPCFKKCNLGSDCTGLNILPTSPPPPPSSGSNGSGPDEAPNCSRNIRPFAVILLSAMLLRWL